jgi:uncharacterized membrane protein
MVDVLTEIVINKPLHQVAAFAADPDNAPVWYENIKSAEWMTPKPVRVGSRIIFRARFLGKDLEYTYEVTNYIPDRLLTMQTAQGPFPMQTTYIWAAEGNDHTRMTLRNKGEPSGFSKVFTPMMSFMMRRANRKDLRKIKLILEMK